jgi:hypothetical protein
MHRFAIDDFVFVKHAGGWTQEYHSMKCYIQITSISKKSKQKQSIKYSLLGQKKNESIPPQSDN